MILPVVAYGHPVLRKKSLPVSPDYPELNELLANMFDTMYATRGVGLAAPQIGRNIRVFVIDATPYAEEYGESAKLKKVFINAEILSRSGEEYYFNEGCLSVPDIREEILRPDSILMRYKDENFNDFEEEFSGVVSRVIQHEYDHLEGILFPDKVPPLRRMLIKGKLNDIVRGRVDPFYRMVYAPAKGRR